MTALGLVIFFVLAFFSFRGSRWAYGTFLVFAVGFIPARAGFALQSLVCETSVGLASAAHSLLNWKHVLLCAVVTWMTVAQLRQPRTWVFVVAVLGTVSLGLVAELEQGLFRDGHCRLRDLVPDTAGAVLGAMAARAWRRRQANNEMH
jgi:VanZ family protein